MRKLAFFVALVLGACGQPTDDHNVWQGGGEAPRNGQGGATSSTVVSVGNTVATTTTSGAGASPTSTAASGAGGQGDEACTPDPNDDPCIDCLKQDCCPEIEACKQDVTCQCWIDCALNGFIGCELCDPANAELDQLLNCGQTCQLECGFI